MLVVELKSEALKERHWKQLMKRLNVSWVLSELTLGHIWDIDLQRHESIVKDVISVAQGEMALEEFLKQVCSLSLLLSSCSDFFSVSFFKSTSIGVFVLGQTLRL